MSPRKTIVTAAAAVLLFGARAFSAILATDVNAMTGFKGTQNFDATLGVLSMRADVDYAVYAPGMFNQSFGAGADPSNGAAYVYAYQIHSTGLVGNSLMRDPAFLSVGFDGTEMAQNIGFLDDNLGDNPVSSTFIIVNNPPFTSATWDFNPPIVDATSSEILLFTSAFQPEFDDASVQGGGLSTQRRLPSPVPEPGTILGACGLVAALLMRRRVSK